MSALDVLAANVAVANTTRQNDRYTSIVTCADCTMEAREALAAIADLIEAAAEMSRLAKGPAGGVSSSEKRAICARMDAALARVGGGK